MTPEDKQLLFQDLCARLPYGVKVEVKNYRCNGEVRNVEIETLNVEHLTCPIERYRPYLRSLSSMIEEEREFLNRLALENSLKCIEEEDPQKVFLLRVKQDVEELAYLYKHHYDVNGLIPSGHAIEVTEENNPYN